MTVAEQIALMCDSEDVKLLDIGVVARWLAENTEVPDPLDAAKELIAEQVTAGLATFRLMDLRAFIAEIKASRPPAPEAVEPWHGQASATD